MLLDEVAKHFHEMKNARGGPFSHFMEIYTCSVCGGWSVQHISWDISAKAPVPMDTPLVSMMSEMKQPANGEQHGVLLGLAY